MTMINHEHVRHQIPDYVLGLLTRQERLWVEQHTAVCSQCRQQLHQESELGRLVRTTLALATQPAPLRLRQLMPAPPPARRLGWQGANWAKQFALAALLLLLIWSGFNLIQQQYSGSTTPPNQLAVTATVTQKPTMTLASLEGEQGIKAISTAVPDLNPEPAAPPGPIPTPIAALAPLSLN